MDWMLTALILVILAVGASAWSHYRSCKHKSKVESYPWGQFTLRCKTCGKVLEP